MNDQAVITPFVKSSYSGGTANECVEVAHTADGGRAVRDSKNPDEGSHRFSPHAWAAFIADVKAGTFDL